MIEENGTFRSLSNKSPGFVIFESKLSFSEAYANYIVNKSLRYRINKNNVGIMQQNIVLKKVI